MDGGRTDGLIQAAGRAGTGMTAKEVPKMPLASHRCMTAASDKPATQVERTIPHPPERKEDCR
jgi:hypothetical protein